jgi:glycosyltransferase involved in cell wall biosynthesis
MWWLLWLPWGVMTVVLLTNLCLLIRARRRTPPPAGLRLSILVPARNEERNLERLLPSLLCQEGVDFEVVVYDDGSTDRTAAVVERTADPRVRLLHGTELPPGWVGKVHALYQASRVASGDALLFLDADTILLHPRALASLRDRFAALPPRSVLTAVPRFRGGGALLVSVVPYALLTSLPLLLVRAARSRYLAALNGQCWLISRDDYLVHQPHLNHPGDVLEDMRIGRYLAGRGVVPRFVDLRDDLEVWMYAGVRQAWHGFRKNAFLLTGGRPLGFAAWFVSYGLVFLVLPVASPVALALAYATKLIADRYSRFSLLVSVLAPLSFALWAVLLLDSATSHWLGRVTWKGRNVALLRRG